MWIILLVIFLVMVFYHVYMKDYTDVIKIFNSLEKTLDARDLLVMKLVPEISDKNKQSRIVELVEARMKNKKVPYTEKMKLDVQLNEELKEFYNLINKKTSNQVIKITFASVIELEKKLKKIRQEYNYVVEKYNMNLVMHKFICVRVIHMKPLDTYSVI